MKGPCGRGSGFLTGPKVLATVRNGRPWFFLAASGVDSGSSPPFRIPFLQQCWALASVPIFRGPIRGPNPGSSAADPPVGPENPISAKYQRNSARPPQPSGTLIYPPDHVECVGRHGHGPRHASRSHRFGHQHGLRFPLTAGVANRSPRAAAPAAISHRRRNPRNPDIVAPHVATGHQRVFGTDTLLLES